MQVLSKLPIIFKIVSFDQNRETIDPTLTLRRALAPDGDSVVYNGRSLHVVSWAKKFLFRPDQLETPVGQLSGGEQARILIAGLMRQPADILLLDEPTNDLDIASLDVLEASLLDFPGALVLVTHDRYLLDRVCHRLLGFGGRHGVSYYADYEQWLNDLPQAGKTRRKQERKSMLRLEKARRKKRAAVVFPIWTSGSTIRLKRLLPLKKAGSSCCRTGWPCRK